MIGTTRSNAKGSYSVTVNVGFGTSLLQVVAKSGKKSATATLSVSRPDTVPPVITTSVLKTLLNANPTITGTVTDAFSTVSASPSRSTGAQ